MVPVGARTELKKRVADAVFRRWHRHLIKSSLPAPIGFFGGGGGGPPPERRRRPLRTAGKRLFFRQNQTDARYAARAIA